MLWAYFMGLAICYEIMERSNKLDVFADGKTKIF